jgi:tRNA(Ile)-lysidine synthase
MGAGCYNEIMFLERLAYVAEEKCGLNLQQPILLGVSGGADSLALLHGLFTLGYNLEVAHVDHMLRMESPSDAEFVQKVAESQGIPCFTHRVNVSKIAQSAGQSIEEAARIVRYQFLFDQARLHQCQAVAVGHHADDQVETVLMHFLRGAALPGLTGMTYRRIMPRWDPAIPIVRPLLGFWRDEIDAYLQTTGLMPCVDPTNLDTQYYRNRLRHALIPQLTSYNPQIKTAIWRMANVLEEDALWLDALTERAFDDCLMAQTDDLIELDRQKFLELSLALKRRTLRHAIAQLCPDFRDVGFDVITRGVAFAETDSTGGEIDLIAHLNLTVIDDTLIIKKWEAELPDGGQPLLMETEFTGELAPGCPVSLRHGWRIEAHLVEEVREDLLTSIREIGPDEAWLDFDRLGLPLLVRGAQEGERFHPLGLDGHSQRLQDFFVNLKIPAHLRPLWPLVLCGDRVAWVVGLRPSDDFKVRGDIRRVLKLKLRNHTS